MRSINKLKIKIIISSILILLVTLAIMLICGVFRVEDGNVHFHVYGDWVAVQEPTCFDEGIQEKYCDCGEKKVAYISARGHSFGEWSIVEAATEQKNGFVRRDCACGTSESREYSTTGYVAGNFFVDGSADENGDGSYEKPFKSIKQARNAVRSIDKKGLDEIIVYVASGEYSVDSLKFEGVDSGSVDCPIIYRSFGGKTTLNSGVSIRADSFIPAKKYAKVYSRLPDEAKDNVVVVDLSSEEYGLNRADYGDVYSIGTYPTADRYKGENTGEMFAELFVGGRRQILARYPNEDYLFTGTPVLEGISTSAKKENGDPMGDTLAFDTALALRIASWKDPESVWAFGFWRYDWADSSTPIESIDVERSQITFKYQSFFGIKEGAPYYFYNCLEELDTAGEYYLDREDGLLCYYPDGDFGKSEITLSLSAKPILEINASHISFEGFELTGTRSNAVVINGNNVKVENCTIKGVGGNAILANGENIKINSNTIAYIGRDGIAVSGGERATLKPSNNIVSNNIIHDWAQVYKTYRAGISLHGVGNVCSHNELFNSPHLAITYSGNNNIVEYNLIHDVCLETDDAGAIYAGRSWTSYGNYVRYNLIYSIGAGGHKPDGIYMDDAISGQNIYGNILIDIPKYAIHIGGGRDMNVYGNMILNPGECGIRYDVRAREGVLNETWFSEHVKENSGDLWIDLYGSPWQSEAWQNAFPQYKDLTDDFANPDDPSFIPNPSGSSINRNIIYSLWGQIGKIDSDVYKYSDVSDNDLNQSFFMQTHFGRVNESNYAKVYGKYLSKNIEDFANIHFETIGTR